MPPSSPFTTGELIGGRYRAMGVLGSGGMADVIRAEDTQLGRTVAIKRLRDQDAAAADRARSEMALLASLNHPGLVTLFDARIAEDGQTYLVMEFVDGVTLAERLDGGPLPSDEVGAIALDLTEALAAVHAAGIVHRDVKPANILLAAERRAAERHRARLADFGIAHLAGTERFTEPGLVVGTAAFLAPEQVRGESPAPAADVYALGLVLLQALTGQRAFPQATGVESVVVRLTNQPLIPPSVGPEWAPLLARMTAIDPTARPTAVEVAAHVRDFAHPHGDLAPSPQRAAAAWDTPTVGDIDTVAAPAPAPAPATRTLVDEAVAASAVPHGSAGAHVAGARRRTTRHRPGSRGWALAASATMALTLGCSVWLASWTVSAGSVGEEVLTEQTVRPTPAEPRE